MIENEKCECKIIFPDYKFNINLNIGRDNYTIKNLIQESKKQFEKEYVLTLVFRDSDNNVIATNNDANMLTRLDEFKIDINHGERLYTCVNPKYLANNNIDTCIEHDKGFLNSAMKLASKYSIPLNKILVFEKSNDNHLTYRNILDYYLRHKYTAHFQLHQTLENLKERRIGKIMNVFFYATLLQVTILNLCTFVFFNWDIMEPITTCITYSNVIAGYYFWATTQSDYEIHSIYNWVRSKRLFRHSLNCQVIEEREEVKNILDNKI
jgi:hypothetical protein